MIILDKTVDFSEDTAGLVVKHDQIIPDDFIAQLKRQKIDPDHNRSGEFLHVASIPVSVDEKWLREGYDLRREPVRDTIKRLKAEHLDAFIVTNKQI